MTDELQYAIDKMTRIGHHIEKQDFPPPPLPGLYLVDGRELTEMQVIHYASQIGD